MPFEKYPIFGVVLDRHAVDAVQDALSAIGDEINKGDSEQVSLQKKGAAALLLKIDF